MQYAPPYYYAGGNQQPTNPQQPQQTQQPQLHMPDHQLYTQPPHGMPTYPMTMPPHQPHPALTHPSGDFNMLTKPKRKQVKNACVNCQKACKKCDDGRPCQRCIKYGLTDTCTNSIRKERKKGVKRGPYKRRNQSNGESSSTATTSTYSNPTTNVPTPYQTYGSYETYPSTNPTAPGVAYSNPMQQYVMAMQQQQAMYQNLPYQQTMTTATSSPSLSHTPNSMPSGASVSAQHSPVINNANTTTVEPKEQSSSATTTTTTTASVVTNDNNKTNDDDDDGSKLNILSQLCSDVLDRSPKEEHATMTPPPIGITRDQSTPTNTNTATNDLQQNPTYNQQQQQQHTPMLSTPVSSSPSSANASPTLYKQDPTQMVYPQQQQPQQQQQGQSNWQGHW
ncbi:uncharacterized protein BX664DRAFT_382973 [Halteromyces radiatus]|uniref:uncharacterized protein n=1 Tax=Halteromyces radiatus TaxID=101107 RepID=UPI0022200C0D|nr:uncharacterized protein BX664DRAFT_382973 [Halteromyces radiatus]KAI8096539.1 hypothetical protein BX664DRAFT_382973 [Halteromyces radiatus]